MTTKKKRPKNQKLTVERRVGLLYKFFLDLQERPVWNEREAENLSQSFREETARHIKNHARDLLKDLRTHFENQKLSFIPRKEILGLLSKVLDIIGDDSDSENYCLNCDRTLAEHEGVHFGALTLRVCDAHPEREMLIVGRETARAIEERTGLLLERDGDR